MQDEILMHFGLVMPLDKVGYFETDGHKELFKDIRNVISEGKLIALFVKCKHSSNKAGKALLSIAVNLGKKSHVIQAEQVLNASGYT